MTLSDIRKIHSMGQAREGRTYVADTGEKFLGLKSGRVRRIIEAKTVLENSENNFVTEDQINNWNSSIQSVTGLDTDNTDPLNPVVQISVDGVTITGDGTPGNPLVSLGGGGSVSSVTDDGNGVVSVDNTDPVNPVIGFNGVNVDGVTITGDGTAGNPLVASGGTSSVDYSVSFLLGGM